MPLKNLNNLRVALAQAASEKNLALRGVRIAVVIAQALREIGQDPVLVGGAAVEFYTEGNYATKDIDMVTFGSKELVDVMQQLGFEKHGKDYLHEVFRIYIEFPSDCLGPEEKKDEIDVNGSALNIISLEDLVIDRLCAYKFWKSEKDGVAALLLLESGNMDVQRLENRSRAEDVFDALTWIREVYEEIVRNKIKKTQASKRLSGWLQQKRR
ncbi:MAG: hypothetical protein HY540_00090 [Deltaproteobacteria bacterium]|nr:hypothetical protein [Deltaproteobacteria bacterium]